MIYTSSHSQYNDNYFKPVSISGNRGKDAGYVGECYPALAPKLGFWKMWHNNIEVISEEENNRFYIREFYKQVLSKLDPNEVYNELNGSVLLCYEDHDQFCHRHIVAAWLELYLDINVSEISSLNNNLDILDKPLYIKEYLIDEIKKIKDMKDFTSLRALYVYEKGEKCLRDAYNNKDDRKEVLFEDADEFMEQAYEIERQSKNEHMVKRIK